MKAGEKPPFFVTMFWTIVILEVFTGIGIILHAIWSKLA